MKTTYVDSIRKKYSFGSDFASYRKYGKYLVNGFIIFSKLYIIMIPSGWQT